MITARMPDDWRQLQQWVAEILKGCGFHVEIEKGIPTARGDVEIDVYAEETIRGRTYRILCECKHWKTRVPQNVIHGFRTVVADSGSNVGYIISTAGFQSGAMTAAELTNLRLQTWPEFQTEFEQSWVEHCLLPTVAEELDPLLTYTEPLLPRAFETLSDEGKAAFIALKERYDPFGWIMMAFTPYVRVLHKEPFEYRLPLRRRLPPDHQSGIPDAVLDAEGYWEFLDAALENGKRVISEFRQVLGTNAA